jgi:hypothetical protein
MDLCYLAHLEYILHYMSNSAPKLWSKKSILHVMFCFVFVLLGEYYVSDAEYDKVGNSCEGWLHE